MKTALVIPTYCEAENIGGLLKKIDRNCHVDLLIVVDDNSPDGTGSMVADYKPDNIEITLVKRAHKSGIGSARKDGIRVALKRGCNYILTMDADNHEPSFIPQLISKCREGYDLVIGSRYVGGGKTIGWNWRRKLVSMTASTIARNVLKLPVKDCTSGFRCFSKLLAKKIVRFSKTKGSEFQEEILYFAKKSKYHIAEVPITFIGRKKGKSKFEFYTILSFLFLITKIALAELRGGSYGY